MSIPLVADKQGSIAKVMRAWKATPDPGTHIFEAVARGLLNMYIMTVGVKLKSAVCKKLSSHQGPGGE